LLLFGFPFINPILAAIGFPIMLVGAAVVAIGATSLPPNIYVELSGLFIFLFGLM